MATSARLMASRDLTQWFDDAQHALDSGAPLTVDHLRALVATPEQSRHDGAARSTWWSEELARVATRKARDHFPAGGTVAELDAWRGRQDRYTDMMEDLADAHAECIASAGAAPKPKRAKRITAAELSVRAVQPEDAAA